MYDCVTSRADRTQITDWIGLIFGVYVSELVHMMDENQILRSSPYRSAWLTLPSGESLKAGALVVADPDPVNGALHGQFRYDSNYLEFCL
jgi:hypothetical protein